MISPLITTKLNIPKPRQGLVSRQEILDRLNIGLRCKLTLISASSGYGKTTLMSEWCLGMGKNYPVAWVSLDEGDNDPTRFLAYMIAALQYIQDGLGQDAEAVIKGAQNPLDTAIVSLLINELSAVSKEFALILEDFHVIKEREIHQMLVFLLEHLPPQMHLVILTRADPPWPLARFRARGELAEIRDRDLQFSHEQAMTLLREMVGLSLSEEDVQILLDRTEGWITGLQLAALSIRGRENPTRIISAFGGGHEYIVDYLIEEVLERQPENLKMFLLQTSILSRLNGSLCETLTGQSDGESTLEHLEKSNLFVTSLGDDHRWYRYHHLFADVMTNHLERFFSDQIHELHLRAARWFQENKLSTEAIEHALAGHDFLLAAEIVEVQATDLLKLGSIATLLGWLNKLPPEIIAMRPLLGVTSAWIYLLIGKLDNIENYLAAVEKNLNTVDNPDDLKGQVAAIRSYAAARLGNLDRAVEQARTALEMLAKDDITVRCVVTFILGGVYQLRQDMPRALVALQEAAQLGELDGNIHVAVGALSSMGEVLKDLGNLAESEKAYYQALELGSGHSGQPLPITAGVHSNLAELRLAQRDFVGARKIALTGLKLGEKWINTDSQVSCFLVLAQVEHIEGNPDEARAALEKAKRFAASYQIPAAIEEKINTCENALLSAPAIRADQSSLPEPITKRELEVLQLFAEGLTNQEIANRLYISLGTVKAHSSNIYRKFDVRNRTQAVRAARELKLLE